MKKKSTDPRTRLYLPVPTTPKPRRIMRPMNTTDDEVEIAVQKAEYLARIAEHSELTPDIANHLRVIAIYSCLYVAKGLDTHRLTAELLRDIYPYARLFAKDAAREVFELVVEDMRRNAPKLYKAMTKGDAA